MALTAQSFVRGLARRGFVELGSGYFSFVYAKPGSERVIKVCTSPDGWVPAPPPSTP